MMNTDKCCEELIKDIINAGGVIVDEKLQNTNFDCFARSVTIKKDKCNFKISYLKMGDKQIVVQKTCNCDNCGPWKLIPKNCLN